MRNIKYLSPTSVKKFYSDKEDFYMTYLADNRDERPPQTQPMSVGSSFDAYIKSYLYKQLKLGDDERFELRTLFEEQVEEHNRDWAWDAGKKCFEAYKKIGAVADLMIFLINCEDPQFEFDMYGSIDIVSARLSDPGEATVNLRGKPDLYFTHLDEGVRVGVLLDWKVNGYCSKRAPSPAAGYLNMRYCDGRPSKSYKECLPIRQNGITINAARRLETGNKDWATQLAIYGWLMGESIGSEFITGIDQLICTGEEIIGVAQHRSFISKEYQEEVWGMCKHAWARCKDGHFFDEMSIEESQNKCKVMDGNIVKAFELDRER